jgi:hypothetical protein
METTFRSGFDDFSAIGVIRLETALADKSRVCQVLYQLYILLAS